jgi:hypothetical protein
MVDIPAGLGSLDTSAFIGTYNCCPDLGTASITKFRVAGRAYR